MVMIQIIFSGDVHPQLGPTSKQSKFLGMDSEENHSSESTVGQYANSCIKIADLNIRFSKSREHFLPLQHTIKEHDFNVFTVLYQGLGLT